MLLNNDNYALLINILLLFQRAVAPGPGGSGRGGSFEGPGSPPEPQPVMYRVVGSRSHIKKADSSQQTENSAFR